MSERVRQFVCVCSLLTWTGSTGFPKPSPVRCLYGTYGIGWQQQHAVPSLPYRPSHCVCARAWRIPGPSLNLACIQFNSTSSLGTPAHRLLSTPDIGSNHLLFFFALNYNFLPFPLPAAIILAWFFCLLPPAFFSLPAVFLLTVCLPFRTDAAPIRFFFKTILLCFFFLQRSLSPLLCGRPQSFFSSLRPEIRVAVLFARTNASSPRACLCSHACAPTRTKPTQEKPIFHTFWSSWILLTANTTFNLLLFARTLVNYILVLINLWKLSLAVWVPCVQTTNLARSKRNQRKSWSLFQQTPSNEPPRKLSVQTYTILPSCSG